MEKARQQTALIYTTVGLFVSSLFTETRSFCLFFGPIVNSSREEAADGSSTHCRAEGAPLTKLHMPIHTFQPR